MKVSVIHGQALESDTNGLPVNRVARIQATRISGKNMDKSKAMIIREVALPWSDGSLSARVWQSGERIVAGVPELGLNCYGATQSEAVFRLFTSLLKYYRQLKESQSTLNTRGQEHLRLLKGWVKSVERRMAIGQAVALSGAGGAAAD